MKILSVILLLFWVVPGDLLPQKILTLKECYDKALSINPLENEKEAYTSIYKLRDKNLSKGWLPSLDAGATFLYNSDVVDIGSALGSLPVPGIADAIKPLPHEQYKITVDINQVIYDGGKIKSARALEKAELGINEKQTETDLYKIKAQINSYYFSILLLTGQKELQKSYLGIIQNRLKTMESALKNGIIMKPDIDVLTSEKIKLEQQISETDIKKTALLRILSDITGIQIDSSATLVIPVQAAGTSDEIHRPELELFSLRTDQLAAGLKTLESNRMPKAFGFATLGYGNPPGSNFFRNEFAPYYIIGAGIKWNIFDWNKTKNDKQVINLQREIIDGRKSDLTDNLKRMLDSKKAEISSLRSIIETDTELIALRKRITAAAESQYENQTITATEYMNEINSEQQVMINHEIHKINLAMKVIEYMNISGKEIE